MLLVCMDVCTLSTFISCLHNNFIYDTLISLYLNMKTCLFKGTTFFLIGYRCWFCCTTFHTTSFDATNATCRLPTTHHPFTHLRSRCTMFHPTSAITHSFSASLYTSTSFKPTCTCSSTIYFTHPTPIGGSLPTYSNTTC